MSLYLSTPLEVANVSFSLYLVGKLCILTCIKLVISCHKQFIINADNVISKRIMIANAPIWFINALISSLYELLRFSIDTCATTHKDPNEQKERQSEKHEDRILERQNENYA